MIVSSIISHKNIQIDGRTEVREIHTDDQGVEYIYDYMADPKMDTDARLAERVKELNNQLTEDEKNAPFMAQQKIDDLQGQIDTLTSQLKVAQDELSVGMVADAIS